MKTLCSTWVRLLAPIIPFTCEDLWKEIGDGLVSFAPWPESDTAKMDDPAEIAEELLVRTVEDIESILRILKTPPRKVTICVAPSWKWDILTLIAEAPDKKNVIRDVMQKEDIKTRGREAADAVKQCTNLFHKLPSDLVDRIVSQKPDELAIFKGASAFLVDDTKLEIEVVPADACHHMKAGSALPFKPAIIIE
jgi:leucyl-tRNA synthetase